MHWSLGYHAMITCLIIHCSCVWPCTDHVAGHTLFTWLIMHWLIMCWSRGYHALITCLSWTDHVTNHELITQVSCTDHVADHTLFTLLIMHWSGGYHALVTWLVIHWSRAWSCTDYVTDHALITWLIMHWSWGNHALLTWLIMKWSRHVSLGSKETRKMIIEAFKILTVVTLILIKRGKVIAGTLKYTAEWWGCFTTHPMDVVNVRAKVGLAIFLIHLKFDLELLI